MNPEDSCSQNPGKVIYRCRLHFRDKAIVTGEIATSAPFENCTITYAGAVERLPFRFDSADTVSLEAFFRHYARQLHARFTEVHLGEFPAAQAELEPDEPFRHL